MAVRSGLAEDVNSGPRVEENLEIRMKDKQPQDTEADGKEKKQAFESRRVDVVVTVDEDGSIIGRRSSNVVYNHLPGVVYEYFAVYQVLNLDGDIVCQQELENLLINTIPQTVEQGGELYNPLITGTTYGDPANGAIAQKMAFGYNLLSVGGRYPGVPYVNNRVSFAVWNTHYQDAEGNHRIRVIGEGMAPLCVNPQVFVDMDIDIVFPTVEAFDVGYDEQEIQGIIGCRPREADGPPESLIVERWMEFFVNQYVTSFGITFNQEYPVSFSYLQTFTSDGVIGTGFDDNGDEVDLDVVCSTPQNVIVVDYDEEDPHHPFYAGDMVVKAVGVDYVLFETHDSPYFQAFSFLVPNDSDNAIHADSYNREIYFSIYLMMRVGSPDNWYLGSNWIPLSMIRWHASLTPICGNDHGPCLDCGTWNLENHGDQRNEIVNQLVENYPLPSWAMDTGTYQGISQHSDSPIMLTIPCEEWGILKLCNSVCREFEWDCPE